MHSKPPHSVLPVLLVLIACGPTSSIVGPSQNEESTSSGASETSGSSTATTAAQNEPASSSSSSDDGSGSTDELPSNFLAEPDNAYSFECDLWAQDCPPGEKCNAWANDGGGDWNATACVPIVPNPDAVGEPCSVVGEITSGIDTCELGAMCWEVDPKTNEGICRAYCQGEESDPYCEDPDTQCGGHRSFPVCVPLCCPVEQDCPEGEGCYAVSEDFYCAPDASGDLGAFGDACEFINVCDPGMICLDPSVVPPGLPCHEGAVGCCTPFCVVGSSSCSELDPAMECAPWYEDGHAPPGFEFTGVCVLPS